jgi:hypothetical protein
MRRIFILALLAGCNDRPLGPVASSGAALCQFDPADHRAVLANLVNNELSFIHGDGSRTRAYLFDHPEARNFFGQSVVARGDFVLASAGWVIGGDAQFAKTDLVLLDRSGTVRWKRSFDGSTSASQMFLNRHGAVAAAIASDALLVDADGHERTLSGMTPLAEPTEDGSVGVRGPWKLSGEVPGDPGWVRPGASSIEPLALVPTQAYATPILVAGRMVYLAAGEGGALLVSELPGDARKVLLPGADANMVGITDSLASGWVLVGEWRSAQYLVNVLTLEARPVGMTTPEGFRPFQGALYGPRLDSDGALLVGLRDDYAGALFRSNDGRGWQRVGGTVTNVLDIDPIARGGTYLIEATSSRYSVEEWTPPPPDRAAQFDGDVVQLVRPSAGIARTLQLGVEWLDRTTVQLSDDGRCVAYTDQELTAYDVERDQRFGFGTAGAFSWIE